MYWYGTREYNVHYTLLYGIDSCVSACVNTFCPRLFVDSAVAILERNWTDHSFLSLVSQTLEITYLLIDPSWWDRSINQLSDRQIDYWYIHTYIHTYLPQKPHDIAHCVVRKSLYESSVQKPMYTLQVWEMSAHSIPQGKRRLAISYWDLHFCTTFKCNYSKSKNNKNSLS